MQPIINKLKDSLGSLQAIAANSGDRWLVCRSDGFRVVAAVALKSRGKLQFEHLLASAEYEPKKALLDIAEQLSLRQVALPKRGILIAPGMVAGLLDLPVDSSKPRPAAQMQELVRWELESYIGDYNDCWNLGATLVGRGNLSRDQRQQVAVELEIRRDSGGGKGMSRFGEVAIELGLIERSQLDEALAIQERMVMLDEQMCCGWMLQQSPLQVLDTGEEDKPQWLGCGISRVRRNAWFAAFNTVGCKLQSLLPMAIEGLPQWLWQQGQSALQLEDGDDVLLLNIMQEQLVACRIRAGHCQTLNYSARREGELSGDELAAFCSEHLRPEVKSLLLCGEPQADEVVERLGEKMQRPVRWLLPTLTLPDSGCELHAGDLLALESAARQQLLGVDSLSAAAFDPPPPKWRDSEFLKLALPAAALVILLAQAVSMVWQRGEHERRLVELDREFKQAKSLQSQSNSLNGEGVVLEREVQALRKELQQMLAKVETFRMLIERQKLAPRLLRVMAQSVDEDVLLEQIVEPRRSSKPGLRLIAWSASEPRAEAFVEKLEKRLAPLNFRVFGTDVRSSYGRYNLHGYTIELWILPKPPAELDGDFEARSGAKNKVAKS